MKIYNNQSLKKFVLAKPHTPPLNGSDKVFIIKYNTQILKQIGLIMPLLYKNHRKS